MESELGIKTKQTFCLIIVWIHNFLCTLHECRPQCVQCVQRHRHQKIVLEMLKRREKKCETQTHLGGDSIDIDKDMRHGRTFTLIALGFWLGSSHPDGTAD